MLSCPENLALKCFQDENYKLLVEVSIIILLCLYYSFINNKILINKFVANIFRINY